MIEELDALNLGHNMWVGIWTDQVAGEERGESRAVSGLGEMWAGWEGWEGDAEWYDSRGGCRPGLRLIVGAGKRGGAGQDGGQPRLLSGCLELLVHGH